MGICYLAELTVADFAIIDRLPIALAPGLCVFTGETGAGKSIIVEALAAALGARSPAGAIRSGAERAWMEAVFAFPREHPELAFALEEMGCPASEGLLVLSRDILPSRTMSRVNGRTVTGQVLQQLGAQLVDIHSQGDQVSLMQARQQRDILDRYGGLAELRDQMAAAAHRLSEARRERRELAADARQVEREAVLLRHELAEIDAAAIEPGEDERLAAERLRLKHALRLRSLAAEARAALRGGDQGSGALELLGEAARRLGEIQTLDPASPVGGDGLLEVMDAVETLQGGLERYEHSLGDDPGALEAVEERLLLLADLRRKYGESLQEVLRYREEAARRFALLEHREERVAELQALEEDGRRQAEAIAAPLSRAREQVARQLEAAAERELADLGMGGTRFLVQVVRQPDAEGLAIEGEEGPVAFDETGVDRVEFLIAPNPGEPLRPLARIASGGELSRIMLALKSVLSQVDQTSVLVFDELDHGVGGRMGHVVGEKLWGLSRDHQVLAITHLPQVACYADAQLAVSKGVEGGRTVTRVRRVEGAERVSELALMLAGPHAGEAAERSARELLGEAERWKEGGRSREGTAPGGEGEKV